MAVAGTLLGNGVPCLLAQQIGCQLKQVRRQAMESYTKGQDTSSSGFNQLSSQIIWKSPTELIPHPLNTKIYGENEDIEELVEAIRESDLIKTIVITPENRIISGHRRVAAAIALGIDKVEVRIRHFDSELDEIEALLRENQYRQKTVEQKIREGSEYEALEAERAVLRRRATQNNNAARAEWPNLAPPIIR